eukprot:494355_1
MLKKYMRNHSRHFACFYWFRTVFCLLYCIGTCMIVMVTYIILTWNSFQIHEQQLHTTNVFRLDIGFPIIGRDQEYISLVMQQLIQSIEYSKLEDVRIHVISKNVETYLCNEILSYTKNIMVKCSTIPDYNNENNERHNFDMIALQRNIIIQDANKQKRDGVLFVDSDIILNSDTIHKLVEACTTQPFDVCIAAYHPRWSEEPVVAVGTDIDHKLISVYKLKGEICHKIVGSGAGCILVTKSAFGIPFEEKETISESTKVIGEDVGWMINAYKANKSICAIPKYHVTHLGASSLMDMIKKLNEEKEDQ